MEFKRIILVPVAAATVCMLSATTSCSSGKTDGSKTDVEKAEKLKGRVGGPQLGTPGGGPVIDKSGDETLQAMIATEVPQFEQLEYVDEVTGKSMKYNLFSPKMLKAGQKYPLVLFMADASTPGTEAERPLTQGYGALVWATADWQAENPCYVLVPQFSGVAVNDAYEHTDEVDMVIRLVDKIAGDKSVDRNRLYTTGQSMGGMISMYYNIAYPDVFAASMFVDCHWDTTKFSELVRHKFALITANKSGNSEGPVAAIERAASAQDIEYEFAEWSARLPQAEQDSLASAMLARGAAINLIDFTPKSVLPEDGKGSEHMYSFDYAYRLTPVRQWLFKQSK